RVSNDKDARRVAFRITRKGLEYANSLIAKLEKADLDLRDLVDLNISDISELNNSLRQYRE
ncbi:MAG: hypothetical protein KC493_16700, partial [Bacteriovoracaceae bacterium]|nr:hypothetical protein [Bacteriovoracaceae bacterium]